MICLPERLGIDNSEDRVFITESLAEAIWKHEQLAGYLLKLDGARYAVCDWGVARWRFKRKVKELDALENRDFREADFSLSVLYRKQQGGFFQNALQDRLREVVFDQLLGCRRGCL